MRHVLEHDRRWHAILKNALASFRQRMVLVLFTPWSEPVTHEIDFFAEFGVPEYSFAKQELIDMFGGIRWELIELASAGTKYGIEHVVLLTRDDAEAHVPQSTA